MAVRVLLLALALLFAGCATSDRAYYRDMKPEDLEYELLRVDNLHARYIELQRRSVTETDKESYRTTVTRLGNLRVDIAEVLKEWIERYHYKPKFYIQASRQAQLGETPSYSSESRE